MRIHIIFSLLFIVSENLFSQILPLEPSGKPPVFFYSPSHVLVAEEIAKRKLGNDTVDKKEEQFMIESSYYIQQRLMSGVVLFNDSLSAYVTKVATIILKDDTATLNKLHFYAYKSTDQNAFTSATGNILITVGLIAQLENEAQLAYILAHEITHFKEKHMLKGYLNSEELIEREEKTSYNLLLSSYYSYSQEQELEADQMGFELYKKSPYSLKQALRSFDILDYAELPFDDITFDTTFFNTDYQIIPTGYFRKAVDPIYRDDNYEDRNSTHPNVRKRRMAIIAQLDSIKTGGSKIFIVSKNEFLHIREKARYEICRLFLMERKYADAIYSSFLMLKKCPNESFPKKIIGRSLYELAAYRQPLKELNSYSTNSYLPEFYGYNESGVYSNLMNEPYYQIPDFDDYPGQQQQIFHLFKEMEEDELTVLALSYNWSLHKKDTADQFQKSLCDSLFFMLVNNQNLHLSYFSAINPTEAMAEFRNDSLQRVGETGEVGDSKYSRMDRFRLNSQKDRFIKFAFVEQLKDPEFVKLFKYYVNNRTNTTDTTAESWIEPRTKKELKNDAKESEKYGWDIKKIIVISPDYMHYVQPKPRKESKQNYTKSEQGQKELSNAISTAAKNAGVGCIMLSPFTMGAQEENIYPDLAALNEWFYERMQHGSNGYSTTLNNQAQIDAIIKKYDTRYIMFTLLESEYRKKIQHPFWYAISCVAIVPIRKIFIPIHYYTYDYVSLDLKTGTVIEMKHEKIKKGKEVDATAEFYKTTFEKMILPKKQIEEKTVENEVEKSEQTEKK